MFWGLSMEPQKRYTQAVTESFHISQAAIDVSSVNQEPTPTQVILEYESNDYILATLSKNSKVFQVPLDLNFQKGDHVGFRAAGPAIVHLTGYHILEDDDDLANRLMGGSDDDDTDMEEEDVESPVANDSFVVSGKKRKTGSLSPGKGKKKSKLEEIDDDDDDEPSLGSTLGDSTLLSPQADDSDEDDDDEDDDDDDDDDDEEDDEDEDDEEDDEEDEVVDIVTKKGKSPVVVNGTTPSGKKNKLNLSKTETPKTPKAGKAVKQLNQSKQEKTPKQEKKTPKAVTPVTPGQKKVLEGGIVAEDLKTGDGPPAKPGKMVTVYYVGRLKSNNKQFDATTGGPGFKFRVGRGEVIKGWDVGVNGMRVGGKRRLTIPAGHAYGAKGSPPVIPPNATLVFDVELRGVS